MSRVRCAICRQHLPTLKTLKSHYLASHSKVQIIKELLKSSILNAKSTTNSITKSKKRKKPTRYKTIYLHENVQITYSDNTILIEDESSNDNLIELTFDDAQNNLLALQENTNLQNSSDGSEKENDRTLSIVRPANLPGKRRSKRGKKSKNLFHIGIRKITETPRSLDAHTGEFYECHCMEKNFQKTSSDTESCSDTSKTFYCISCGNGYQSAAELAGHEKSHQFQCKICNQILCLQNYKEHVEQHLVRIYVCHLCGFEFICKDVLIGHLAYHFEQQTFENILNMEQDYNMYGFCNTNFSSGDYYANINNILFFLTYPYDHYYSRNMFMKVVCDICYQEFPIYDYEKHLKIAHFLR